MQELAGKFEVDQRDLAGTSSKAPKKDDDQNGTTFKLEKVLKAMKKKKPIKESNDSELVLMSSMVKKFLNTKGKKLASGGSKRDLKIVTCYNCQGKGRFSKDYKKEKVERPQKEANRPAKEEKRAFITA